MRSGPFSSRHSRPRCGRVLPDRPFFFSRRLLSSPSSTAISHHQLASSQDYRDLRPPYASSLHISPHSSTMPGFEDGKPFDAEFQLSPQAQISFCKLKDLVNAAHEHSISFIRLRVSTFVQQRIEAALQNLLLRRHRKPLLYVTIELLVIGRPC